MRFLNFGSMNLDYTYQVDHILLPGETEVSTDLQVYPGGKGLNQSIALAKAGAEVYHVGQIGEEGGMLLDALQAAGVHTTYVRQTYGRSGHTIIQVDAEAQNNILLYGGANRTFTKEYIDQVLDNFTPYDAVVLQNEINLVEYVVDAAHAKGMQVILNPSPFDDHVKKVDLNKVSIILINEVEGWQMTGQKAPDEILDALHVRFPQMKVVLTLGQDGSIYMEGDERIHQEIFPVKAVDTTAAGDTFTGYFLTLTAEGMDVKEALRMASKASSIAVTRKGAATSIPDRDEVG